MAPRVMRSSWKKRGRRTRW